MKNIFILPLILVAIISCSQAQETSFSTEVLNDKMTSLKGEEMTFGDILDKYRGKTVVIDVWASWCPDCVKGMPKVKELQKQFPNAVYLFLSYDKTDESWKKGIEKYEVKGQHYRIGPKMNEGAFSKGVKLDWIPRYIVVDKSGKIALFKAIVADDENLIATLKKLK